MDLVNKWVLSFFLNSLSVPQIISFGSGFQKVGAAAEKQSMFFKVSINVEMAS